MKYMAMLLAVFMVAGSLAVLPLYAGEGSDHSEPPAVESETVILADDGGGADHAEPSPEEARGVVLV